MSYKLVNYENIICNNGLDFNTFTFKLCRTSNKCSENFDITLVQSETESYTSTEFNKFTYLLDTMINDLQVKNLDSICNGNDNIINLYKILLKNYQFCKINEILDYKGHCICMNNKNCKEKLKSDLDVPTVALFIMGILIIAFMICYFGSITKELKKTENLLKNNNKNLIYQ